MPEDIFTVTDQTERELLWDALVDYRDAMGDRETFKIVDSMINRVSHTFSWVRS